MAKNDRNHESILDALGDARYMLAMLYAAHKADPPLLTVKDEWLIFQILIGCSKMIYLSHVAGAKKNALGKHKKTSRRELAAAALGANITVNPNFGKVTPKKIKNELPDNLREIDSGDVSDTLEIFQKILLMEKTGRPRKKGRPTKDEKSNYYRGRPSFYQLTSYTQALKQVIQKDVARNLIFSFLLQSKLIHKWLDFVCLYSYYKLKDEGLKASADVEMAIKGFVETETN